MYTLECSTVGNPAPTITWSNSGVMIENDGVNYRISSNLIQESFSSDTKYQIMTSNLLISHIQYDVHQSSFDCIADVGGTTLESRSLLSRSRKANRFSFLSIICVRDQQCSCYCVQEFQSVLVLYFNVYYVVHMKTMVSYEPDI